MDTKQALERLTHEYRFYMNTWKNRIGNPYFGDKYPHGSALAHYRYWRAMLNVIQAIKA